MSTLSINNASALNNNPAALINTSAAIAQAQAALQQLGVTLDTSTLTPGGSAINWNALTLTNQSATWETKSLNPLAMMVINAVLQVVLGPAAQVFGALASEVEAAAISLIDSGINGAISGQLDGAKTLENAGIAALEAAAFNAVHVIKADLAIPQTQNLFAPNFDPVAALESASLHALVGCAGSALGGQSCASGAAAGAISDLASNIQTGSQLGQFLVSSLAGGIGAKLAGGDFATGALQGGFGYLFNELAFSMALNSQPTTELVCYNCADGNKNVFAAFTGNGNAIDNPAYADVVGVGPIPPGEYYIVDRAQGGLYSQAVSWLKSLGTNNDHSQWFSLYSTDTKSDSLVIDGVTRGQFRLHSLNPSGSGESDGCVTLCSFNDFTNLRQQLLNTSTFLIPGTNIKAYGTVNVYVPTTPTSVVGHQ